MGQIASTPDDAKLLDAPFESLFDDRFVAEKYANNPQRKKEKDGEETEEDILMREIKNFQEYSALLTPSVNAKQLTSELQASIIVKQGFTGTLAKRYELLLRIGAALRNREKESKKATVAKGLPVKPRLLGGHHPMVRMAIRLLLSLARSVGTQMPEVTESAVDSLLGVLKEMEPLDLREESPETLDVIRTFLSDLAQSPKSSVELKASALSTLFSLGLATGQLRPLLQVVDGLFQSDAISADAPPAASPVSEDMLEMVQRFSEHRPKYLFPALTNLKSVGHAISTEEIPDGAAVLGGDTNGKYVFLQTDKGVLKVGTGFNGTIAGHSYGLCKRFATSAKDLTPRLVCVGARKLVHHVCAAGATPERLPHPVLSPDEQARQDTADRRRHEHHAAPEDSGDEREEDSSPPTPRRRHSRSRSRSISRSPSPPSRSGSITPMTGSRAPSPRPAAEESAPEASPVEANPAPESATEAAPSPAAAAASLPNDELGPTGIERMTVVDTESFEEREILFAESDRAQVSEDWIALKAKRRVTVRFVALPSWSEALTSADADEAGPAAPVSRRHRARHHEGGDEEEDEEDEGSDGSSSSASSGPAPDGAEGENAAAPAPSGQSEKKKTFTHVFGDGQFLYHATLFVKDADERVSKLHTAVIDMEKGNVVRTFVIPLADQIHPGCKCEGCGQNPIVGPMYTCQVCCLPEGDERYKLCHSCRMRGFTSGTHTALHPMMASACEAEMNLCMKNMREGSFLCNGPTLSVGARHASYQFDLLAPTGVSLIERTPQYGVECDEKGEEVPPRAFSAYDRAHNTIFSVDNESKQLRVLPNFRAASPPIFPLLASPDAWSPDPAVCVRALLAAAAAGTSIRPRDLAVALLGKLAELTFAHLPTAPIDPALTFPTRVPYAVDLTPETFAVLIKLLHAVADSFFAITPAASAPDVRRLSDAALSLLRLLRINVQYLCKGMVDYAAVGMLPETREALHKEAFRFIMGTMPSHPMMPSIGASLTSEAIDLLTSGMDVFFDTTTCHALLKDLLKSFIEASSSTFGSGDKAAAPPSAQSKERLQLSLKLMSSMLGMLTSQIGEMMLPRRDAAGRPAEGPAVLTELWDSFLEAHSTETRLALTELTAGKLTAEEPNQTALSLFLQTFQRHLLAMFIDDKKLVPGAAADVDEQAPAAPSATALAAAPYGTPLALLPATYPRRTGIEAHPFFEHLRAYTESLLRRAVAVVQAVVAAVEQGQAAAAPDMLPGALLERGMAILRVSLFGTLLRPFVTAMHLFGPSVLLSGHALGALCQALQGMDALLRLNKLEAAEREHLENEAGAASVPISKWIKSTHPYNNNEDTVNVIKVPGATGYRLRFDPRCASENRYDWLRVWSKESQVEEEALHCWTGADWPKQPVVLRHPVLYFKFHSDGSTVEWGYEVEITAIVSDKVVALPWLLDMAKTVAQQMAECAGLLVEGTPLTEIEQNPHARRFMHSELMKEGLDELFVSLYEKHYRDQEQEAAGPESEVADLLKAAASSGTAAPPPAAAAPAAAAAAATAGPAAAAASTPATASAPGQTSLLVAKRQALQRLGERALETAAATSHSAKTEGLQFLYNVLRGDAQSDGGRLVAWLYEHEPRPALAAQQGADNAASAMRAGLAPLLHTDVALFAEAQAATRLLAVKAPVAPVAEGAPAPAAAMPDPIGAKLRAAWRATWPLVEWMSDQRQRNAGVTYEQLIHRLQNMAIVLLHVPSPRRLVAAAGPVPLQRALSTPAAMKGQAAPLVAGLPASPKDISRSTSFKRHEEGEALAHFKSAATTLQRLGSFRRPLAAAPVAVDAKTAVIMNFMRRFTEAEVICLLAARRDRARCRMQGLKAFRTVLADLKSRVLLCDVLRGLSRAWSHMERPHYLTHLTGLGHLGGQVSATFAALYGDLAKRLALPEDQPLADVDRLDIRIRATVVAVWNLVFRPRDAEFLKQADLVGLCARLMALPPEQLHFAPLRAGATSLFRVLCASLFEEEQRPSDEAPQAAAPAPAPATPPPQLTEYQRFLLKMLAGLLDTAAAQFRADRDNLAALRAQLGGDKDKKDKRAKKDKKDKKEKDKRGAAAAAAPAASSAAPASSSAAAPAPDDAAESTVDDASETPGPAAAAAASEVAQLASARVAGRTGKPQPPVDDAQVYALLSLVLLLLRKSPRVAQQLGLMACPALSVLVGAGSPRVQRAATRILARLLPATNLSQAPKVLGLPFLDFFLEFAAVPDLARVSGLLPEPTIASETTGLGAFGFLQAALEQIEKGEPLYSVQEQLLEKDTVKDELEGGDDDSRAHLRASRTAFPVREISPQSVRALAAEVQDMLHRLLFAPADDPAAPFAAVWRDELKRRVGAAVKALPEQIAAAFPWLADIRKAASPASPAAAAAPRDAFAAILRAVVLLKAVAVGGTAEPLRVGARVLDSVSCEEGTVVAFNFRDPACRVVFDSATKVEPRECRVDSLTVVSSQAPFEPAALPDAPALLRALVETLDWIALNAQAQSEAAALRAQRDEQKKEVAQRKKKGEEKSPSTVVVATPTAEIAMSVEPMTQTSANLLLSCVRHAVMAAFAVFTLSPAWIELIMNEHLVGTFVPMVLSSSTKDTLQTLVTRCAALADRIFSEGIETPGSSKSAKASNKMLGTNFEDETYSATWGSGTEHLVRMALGFCQCCHHLSVPSCLNCDTPFIQPLHPQRGQVQCARCSSTTACRELKCPCCTGLVVLQFGIFHAEELARLSEGPWDNQKDRCTAFLRCSNNAGVMRLPFLGSELCQYDWKDDCLRNSAQDAVNPTVFRHPEIPAVDVWELTGGRHVAPSSDRDSLEWSLAPFFFGRRFLDELPGKLEKAVQLGNFEELLSKQKMPESVAAILGRPVDPALVAAVQAFRRSAFLSTQSDLRRDATVADNGIVSLKPSVLAAMLHALELKPTSRVLVVGNDSGIATVAAAKAVGKGGMVLGLTLQAAVERAFAMSVRTEPMHWAWMAQRTLFAYKPTELTFDRVLFTAPASARLIAAAARLLRPEGFVLYPDGSHDCVTKATRTPAGELAEAPAFRLDAFGAIFPVQMPDQPEPQEKDCIAATQEYWVHECIERGICTKQAAGEVFVKQPFFLCETCHITGRLGACIPCALRCHAGHKIALYKYTQFYCDCPDPKVPAGTRRPACRSLWPEDASFAIPEAGAHRQYAWTCPSLHLDEPHYCSTHYARLLTWAGHPCCFRGLREFECEGRRVWDDLPAEKRARATEEEAKAAEAPAPPPIAAAAAAPAPAPAPSTAAVVLAGDRLRVGATLSAAEQPPMQAAFGGEDEGEGEEEDGFFGDDDEGSDEEEAAPSVNSDDSGAPPPPMQDSVEPANDKTIAAGNVLRFAKNAEAPHCFGAANAREFEGMLCVVRKVAAPLAFVEVLHPERGLLSGVWAEIRCLEQPQPVSAQGAMSPSDEAAAAKLAALPEQLASAEQSISQKLAGAALVQLVANWPRERPFTQDTLGTPRALFDLLKSLIATLGADSRSKEMDMVRAKMSQWIREDYERHMRDGATQPAAPPAQPASAAPAAAASQEPKKPDIAVPAEAKGDKEEKSKEEKPQRKGLLARFAHFVGLAKHSDGEDDAGEEDEEGDDGEEDEEGDDESEGCKTEPVDGDGDDEGQDDGDEEECDELAKMGLRSDGTLAAFLMERAMHVFRSPNAVRKAVKAARGSEAQKGAALTLTKTRVPKKLDMARCLIEESNHNYADNMDYRKVLRIPGARGLHIMFDRRCRTEQGCDRLFFFRDSGYSNQIADRTGTNTFEPLTVPNTDTVYFQFKSDGSSNDWGWRFYVFDMAADDAAAPAAAAAPPSPTEVALRGSIEFAVWALQQLLEQPPALCPQLCTKPVFGRVVRALTALPDKHALFLPLVSIITRLLARWDQSWDLFAEGDDLHSVLCDLVAPVRGAAPTLRPDATLPPNIYACYELLAAVSTAERLQEQKDRRAKEDAKKSADSAAASSSSAAAAPAPGADAIGLDDLTVYSRDLSFDQCLVEVTRINDCLREHRTLPAALFLTAYWNALHDRLIESPHPYTAANWQATVAFPEATNLVLGFDPRTVVDNEKGHVIALSKQRVGGDDIVSIGDRMSKEPLVVSAQKLCIKLDARGQVPSSERNFGLAVFVHPDYDDDYRQRCLAPHLAFLNELRARVCDPAIWTPAVDAALLETTSNFAYQAGSELPFMTPDSIFSPSGAPSEISMPPFLSALVAQQPPMRYNLGLDIPLPAAAEAADGADAPAEGKKEKRRHRAAGSDSDGEAGSGSDDDDESSASIPAGLFATPGDGSDDEAPAPRRSRSRGPAEEPASGDESGDDQEEDDDDDDDSAPSVLSGVAAEARPPRRRHRSQSRGPARHRSASAASGEGSLHPDEEEEEERASQHSAVSAAASAEAPSEAKAAGKKADKSPDALVGLPINLLCLRYHLWRVYNWLLGRCLVGFNLSQLANPWSIASGLAAQRHLIATEVKWALWLDQIERTKYDGNYPNVTVNRTRTKLNPENTSFVQLMDQFQSLDKTRQMRNMRRAFRVKFVGEGATDEGGPYRETLSDLATELTSRTTAEYQGGLPLLVPCPNRIHNLGQNRDCFVVDGTSSEPRTMAMFRFLGKLMGVAIRTRNPINIDLAPIVWKHLVGQKVDIGDIESIDETFVNENKVIREWAAADTFDGLGLTWTAISSAAKEVPLRPSGADEPVAFEERLAYVDAVVKFRLEEGAAQIAEIRRGLCQVVPGDIINLLTWRELERRVCGSPEVDIAYLRRFTRYNGWAATAPTMEFLWRALESFTQEQRRLYLRFVTGRSRVPPPEEFENNRIEIQRFGRNEGRSPDGYLPLSHTCFSSVEIPQYSTYEILRAKLLYAIQNCTSIDADFQATGGFDQEE